MYLYFFFSGLGNDVRKKKSAVFQKNIDFILRGVQHRHLFYFSLSSCRGDSYLCLPANQGKLLSANLTTFDLAGKSRIFFFFLSILRGGNWNCRAVVSKLHQICLFTQTKAAFGDVAQPLVNLKVWQISLLSHLIPLSINNAEEKKKNPGIV